MTATEILTWFTDKPDTALRQLSARFHDELGLDREDTIECCYRAAIEGFVVLVRDLPRGYSWTYAEPEMAAAQALKKLGEA